MVTYNMFIDDETESTRRIAADTLGALEDAASEYGATELDGANTMFLADKEYRHTFIQVVYTGSAVTITFKAA